MSAGVRVHTHKYSTYLKLKHISLMREGRGSITYFFLSYRKALDHTECFP